MTPNKHFGDTEIVENRLRQFIHKYYRVKIFQGLVVSVSITLGILLAQVIAGNIFLISLSIQQILQIGGFILSGLSILYFVCKPLAQRIGWIKGLNFKEASGIIQQKHKSIEDRIINIIELTREKAGKNNPLYDFAISQKTENIEQFNFQEAVSLKKLRVFSFRFLLLAALCSVLVLFWPDFVKKGIGVMWSGNEQIADMKRIEFIILNDSLEVESGRDFLLKFNVQSEFPVEDVAIRVGSNDDKAERVSGGYEYTFRAVNSSVTFRITANTIQSDEYVIKTLKRPEMAGIQLKIISPGYTALESVVVEGDGYAEVPAGSRVIWTIKTVNTDNVVMMDGTDSISMKGKNNLWTYERKINKTIDYELICKNDNGLFINYSYRISIVKDSYPSVEISESRDSTVSSDVYVQGIIQDDYGFSKLEVIIGKMGNEVTNSIEIKKDMVYENFYYTIIPDSNNAVYYFRIWDNDQVTGPKFTDSRKISLKTVSKEEVESMNTKLVDSIKTDMRAGMDAIDKLEKKVSQFKMEMVLGDLKPWEIQERLKELNELKSEVVDLLNNVTKNDQEFTNNEELLNRDREIAEKAKQIRDLMENLLDDEMRELLKQFEELAKEFNAKQADELTDKMEMNLEKLKEQMEMSLELLKKYDLEKELMKQIEQLNQLADSLQNDKEKDEAEGNQLKDEFKKWEQEYQKKLQEDKQFKKPMGLDSLKNEREEVKKAAEELDKKENNKPGSEAKSKASKALKKLSKKMQDMLGMMEGESQSVDLEELRQIRNSLNDFSKKQEELNGRISNINTISPVFTSVIKEQKELESKFRNIRDSLRSIGYKQPVIAKIIGAELFHVETSIKNLFESFSDNRANIVRIEQNRIMSEVNLIAVKLDELINSMGKGSGSGSGKQSFTDRKKPNKGDQKGSEKLGETKSMQESLKEQLKSGIQKMKSGANGKKERGDLARMLGEREMMRKAFERTVQDGGLGNEAREKANQALNMMKEVEKDIIYNRLGDQTLEKDNFIRTRLLEAENAERERENENRRESKEFKGRFEPNRVEFDKQGDKNKATEQMLKYNELKLKRFYQEKYLKYIESTKK